MMLFDEWVCRKDGGRWRPIDTDRQLHEVKSFCFKQPDGSDLGFDKTFNLGTMFVTRSVYKNSALVRRRSNESPIFIGPLFIHGH